MGQRAGTRERDKHRDTAMLYFFMPFCLVLELGMDSAHLKLKRDAQTRATNADLWRLSECTVLHGDTWYMQVFSVCTSDRKIVKPGGCSLAMHYKCYYCNVYG